MIIMRDEGNQARASAARVSSRPRPGLLALLLLP
jgi:hypothetical protein